MRLFKRKKKKQEEPKKLLSWIISVPDTDIEFMSQHIRFYVRKYSDFQTFESVKVLVEELEIAHSENRPLPDIILLYVSDHQDIWFGLNKFLPRIRHVSEEIKLIALANNFIVGRKAVNELRMDYVVNINPLNVINLKKIYKYLHSRLIERESIHPEELEKEKKHFYDSVAKNGMFDERSKKTADTKKEIELLEKNIVGNIILDAGCGNGRVSIPLAKKGYRVWGVDLSSELIKKAVESRNKKIKNFKNPSFSVQNLTKLRFHNNSFDSVIMMWSVFAEIRGMMNRLQVISECARVLKSEGVLLIDLQDVESLAKNSNYDVFKKGKLVHTVDAQKNLVYEGYIPSEQELEAILEPLGIFIKEVVPWTTRTGLQRLLFVCRFINKSMNTREFFQNSFMHGGKQEYE